MDKYEDNLTIEIGIEFLKARNKLRISQEKLSKSAGLSINYVSLLERGKHKNPGIMKLHRLARKLGTSLDTILINAHNNLTI